MMTFKEFYRRSIEDEAEAKPKRSHNRQTSSQTPTVDASASREG